MLFWLVVTLAVVFSFGSTKASAADYPRRPITLICPWGAGGGTDAVSRIIATLLKKELGVPVNVVNRTGGGGAVGHTVMATARPDGYTIGMPTVELTMIHWMGLSKVTYQDITPVAMVNADPAGISVRADSPWKSYKDLEMHIRKNPGQLKNSGSGQGGIWHLAMAGWMKAIGLEAKAIKWIPSKGSAPALQDLMADGIEMSTCSLPETSTLVDAGKVRSLAIMAPERDPNFPDVPTLQEMDMDWTCGSWRGIAAPKGTPKEIVEILEKAVTKVVKSAEFIAFMENRGFGISFLNAADFAKAMAKADKENGEIMKAAGIVK
ncbi:MAG: tripartite tricarboxylate transporter substrate binding protein [Candidatus Latescibacteria bacterium]|nr:tripartite tricarboxylate transporter substrate binding protein [Candidatus Latescibacterota bacterium]